MLYSETRKNRMFDKLYVIAPITNPCRWRSRYELYKQFEQHVMDSGGELYTVEAAFGHRPHVITEAGNPRHIQLRTSHELWHKENLVNIAISRLPSDWNYVAWVDADVTFVRPDWVEETIQQLQHFHLVQMFSEAYDLTPKHELLMKHLSYVWCYYNNIPQTKVFTGYYGEQSFSKVSIPNAWHPGFAWAARREAIDHLGGLLDWAILGAGDNHMAKALFGDGQYACHPEVHPNYFKGIQRWQQLANRHIRQNVGYVDGALLHFWHGKKRDRQYWDRWKILVRNKFDPEIDIKKDWQGLYQLVDHGTMRSIKLRDELRAYFRQRREDSTDYE